MARMLARAHGAQRYSTRFPATDIDHPRGMPPVAHTSLAPHREQVRVVGTSLMVDGPAGPRGAASRKTSQACTLFARAAGS